MHEGAAIGATKSSAAPYLFVIDPTCTVRHDGRQRLHVPRTFSVVFQGPSVPFWRRRFFDLFAFSNCGWHRGAARLLGSKKSISPVGFGGSRQHPLL